MLETTVDAESREGRVRFAVRVENDGDEDVDLAFSDSQRIRITLYRGDENEPYCRSDEEQMFMQVLGSETVPAGRDVVFEEVWDEPEPGEYRAVAEVVCRERELEAETTFSVSS